MNDVAAVFPLTVLAVVLTVAILAIRLDRRLSRGTGSAGDLEPERPAPVGQTRTPWEVTAIDDQLRLIALRSNATSRQELAATVNRLVVASGLPARMQLPPDADAGQMEQVVGLIEQQLGLPPLTPGNEP